MGHWDGHAGMVGAWAGRIITVQQWMVASGIVEGPEGLLLVQNRRRDGTADWSPPGGVVETAEGESVVDGLTREVAEETGLRVGAWEGPLYEVEAVAPGMGWHLRVEVYRALTYEGAIAIDDPDGIVIDAGFLTLEACRLQLATTWLPTHEPLLHWLDERWSEQRSYRYHIEGASRSAMTITRV